MAFRFRGRSWVIAVILLIFGLSPSMSATFSTTYNLVTHYSNNLVFAGPALAYHYELPLNRGAAVGIGWVQMDYFGQFNGIRFSAERVFFSTAAAPSDTKEFSMRAGVWYGVFWGTPVIVVKNGYLDEVPSTFHEVGVCLRPCLVRLGGIVMSVLDIGLSIDPASTSGKINTSIGAISLGYLF